MILSIAVGFIEVSIRVKILILRHSPTSGWNVSSLLANWKLECSCSGLYQGESFLGRKWLIGKKIKKELDKPEGISHAKMV